MQRYVFGQSHTCLCDEMLYLLLIFRDVLCATSFLACAIKLSTCMAPVLCTKKRLMYSIALQKVSWVCSFEPWLRTEFLAHSLNSLSFRVSGSLLLDSLKEHISTTAQDHCKAIYLHVLTTNNTAIHFYENRDFRQHHYLPYYYSIRGVLKDGFTYVLYINGGHPPWTILYPFVEAGKEDSEAVIPASCWSQFQFVTQQNVFPGFHCWKLWMVPIEPLKLFVNPAVRVTKTLIQCLKVELQSLVHKFAGENQSSQLSHCLCPDLVFPELVCSFQAVFCLALCCLFSNKAHPCVAINNHIPRSTKRVHRAYSVWSSDWMQASSRQVAVKCEWSRGKGWQEIVSLALNVQYRLHQSVTAPPRVRTKAVQLAVIQISASICFLWEWKKRDTYLHNGSLATKTRYWNYLKKSILLLPTVGSEKENMGSIMLGNNTSSLPEAAYTVEVFTNETLLMWFGLSFTWQRRPEKLSSRVKSFETATFSGCVNWQTAKPVTGVTTLMLMLMLV